MSIMEKTARRPLRVAGLIATMLFGALAVFAVWERRAQPEDSQANVGIRVTAPTDGQVVETGSDVHFTIEPTLGYSFTDVDVVALGGIHQSTDVGPPFVIDFRLPEQYVGPVVFDIVALLDGGGSTGATVTVYAEPGSLQIPTAVRILPENIAVQVNGEVGVEAVADFDDKESINVTRARETGWSVIDADVAQLVTHGDGSKVLRALDFGETTVRVLYRGIMGAAAVRVGGGGTRGDINGDGAIDRADEEIIRNAWRRSANPGDSRDLNGDGVLDQRDVDILRSLSCGSMADSLIAGGGRAKTDCYAEWSLPESLLRPRKCVPKSRQWCVDGTACDADEERNGTCVFHMRVTLNNSDERFPECTSQQVDYYEITKPSNRAAAKNAVDAANRAALENALATLGTLPLVGSTYTEEIEISVPVKGTKKGAKSLGLLVEGAGGKKDSNKLTLTCYPAPLS